MHDTFTTSDTNLAAYLIACGHVLQLTDDSDPGRVVFELSPVPEAQRLADFADGTATVKVGDFLRWQRHLKRLVFGRAGSRGLAIMSATVADLLRTLSPSWIEETRRPANGRIPKASIGRSARTMPTNTRPTSPSASAVSRASLVARKADSPPSPPSWVLRRCMRPRGVRHPPLPP